jgi:hypothetical protein
MAFVEALTFLLLKARIIWWSQTRNRLATLTLGVMQPSMTRANYIFAVAKLEASQLYRRPKYRTSTLVLVNFAIPSMSQAFARGREIGSITCFFMLTI